ncbi:hypothetical protein [Cytophaga aurantiaca]|uniref:hypothetical protein n=1 Tax=Cytophaga aurantiaca TaxID=29530 RepID=UPI00035F0AEB|nr:hypothetical protein [Cytophaga aurantiaca]
MKNFLSFIFLIILLSSFTLIKTDEPNDSYVGIWTEHWNKSNVDYVDTLKIEVNARGQLAISCINNSNYIYSEIQPKKSALSFVMKNNGFTVQYTLKRINENLITGKIHNSNNQTVKISLKRLK